MSHCTFGRSKFSTDTAKAAAALRWSYYPCQVRGSTVSSKGNRSGIRIPKKSETKSETKPFDPPAAVAIREACKDAGLSVTGSAMKTLTPSVRRAGWNAWLRYACNHREWACGKDASDEDKRCILANFVNSAGEGRLSNEDRFGILSMRKTMTMTLISITMTMNIFLVGCSCQSRPLQRLAQRNHQAGIR